MADTATREEAIVAAATELLDIVWHFAVESGEQWSCTEINALAALYRAAGRDDEADELLADDSSHIADDDEDERQAHGRDEA